MADEANRCVICGHFYRGARHTCVDTSKPPPPPAGPRPVPLPKPIGPDE